MRLISNYRFRWLWMWSAACFHSKNFPNGVVLGIVPLKREKIKRYSRYLYLDIEIRVLGTRIVKILETNIE